MAKARNMVVAQSGGPSPVINNSLRGIIEAARAIRRNGLSKKRLGCFSLRDFFLRSPIMAS